MGLFQSAVETYDAMETYAGVPIEGKTVLAPVGHITAKAKIEITIDRRGNFIQAKAVDTVVILPVTEKSSGRTSAPAGHPLCDRLEYVLDIDEARHKAYVQELGNWTSSDYSNPEIEAVFSYIQGGTCKDDLMKSGLISFDEKNGALNNKSDLVCWRIIDDSGENSAVWENQAVIQSFIRYINDAVNSNGANVDMITGETTSMTSTHLRGVVPYHNRAKLISSNDDENYTFRGRFRDAEEAASIGFESSQKAHNALKWLIANQGVRVGDRVFLCWTPQGKQLPQITGTLMRRREEKILPTNYKTELKKEVMGYVSKLDSLDKAIIVAFDAATPGRLSVSYYNELNASDFLFRLKEWDETCCWYDSRWGTTTPPLRDIVDQAFGLLRNGKWDVDEKLYGPAMQRLMMCRIDKAKLPLDVLRSLIQKSGNLQIYDAQIRNRLLFTSCAVIRKYRWDHKREEWNMVLEENCPDRSYQFGRLLAILEKIERDTYSTDDKREPNAIRMQTIFIKRPGYAFGLIQEQLKRAYYQQLNPASRTYYEQMIEGIVSVISSFGIEEYDKPLEDTYLLGYYLQKGALYKKRDASNREEE